MVSDRGSATLQVLAVLTLAAGLCAAAVIGIMGARTVSAKRGTDYPEHSLFAAVCELSGKILQDASPGADSRFDGIVGAGDPSATFAVTDESSRINPNWIGVQLLEEGMFTSLLREDTQALLLQQSRFDEGFSADIDKRYELFFTPKAIKEYLSPYSFVNLDNIDEFALERLLLDCTGDPGIASRIRLKIRELRIAGSLVRRQELLSLFCGEADTLQSFMGVEPQCNVNFVEPYVLRGLLAYPGFKIANHDAIADVLLEEREQRELTIERVRELSGLDPLNRIFTYLGDTTWFWKLSTQRGNHVFTAILSRSLPDILGSVFSSVGGSMEKGKVTLVSWSYNKL